MATVDVPLASIQVSNIALAEARFRLKGDAQVDDIDAQFQLGVIRPNTDTLGVQIRISTSVTDAFDLAIAYRCVFRRLTPFDENEDPRAFWETVATNLAATILFPFLRAEFMHLLASAGLPGKTLPLINPARMFAPGEVEIPDPPGSSAPEEDKEPSDATGEEDFT